MPDPTPVPDRPDSATQNEPTERDLELDAAGAEAGWDGATTAAERAQGEDHETSGPADQMAYLSKSAGDWLVARGWASHDRNSGVYYIDRVAPDSATEPDTAKLVEALREAARVVGRGRISQIGTSRVYTPQVSVAAVSRWHDVLAGFSVDAEKLKEDK